MHLMIYLDDKGKRVYTLKKVSPSGTPTVSAHPGKSRPMEDCFSLTKLKFSILSSSSLHAARFSPDDKFSRQRVTLKKRFGILPTQLPPRELSLIHI